MKCGWRNSRFFSFIWRYLNLAHYRFQDLDSKRFLARANPEIGLLKHIFKSLNGFGFLGLCTVLIYSHAHFYPLVFICIPKLYPFPNPKSFLSHSYQHILNMTYQHNVFFVWDLSWAPNRLAF